MKTIHPAGYPPPRGYSAGLLARGRTLYVAGQIGWETDGTFASDDLVYQFGRALDHVLAVVHAAGGAATDVAQMTVFVTDMPAYRAAQRALGEAWRARLGRHYPAMALVGVTCLVEPRAQVEIQAIAVLPDTPESEPA